MKSKIIEALLNIGFTQLYSNFLDKLNYRGYEIKVRDSDTLESIFKKVFECGKTIKMWDIKNALEIV